MPPKTEPDKWRSSRRHIGIRATARQKRYGSGMRPLRINEGDLAIDVRSILQQVETGAEVIVERDAQPVPVIRPAEPVRRNISECIALMPANSAVTIDADFSQDVDAAIAAHRESPELRLFNRHS